MTDAHGRRPEANKLDECFAGIPRTLRVGAYDWSIVIDDNESDTCGQAQFETYRIVLWRKNLTSPSHVAGTMLHETLHIMYDNHDLGKLKRNAEEREERIVLGFEAGVISLFRDNPKFVTWMRKWLR